MPVAVKTWTGVSLVQVLSQLMSGTYLIMNLWHNALKTALSEQADVLMGIQMNDFKKSYNGSYTHDYNETLKQWELSSCWLYWPGEEAELSSGGLRPNLISDCMSFPIWQWYLGPLEDLFSVLFSFQLLQLKWRISNLKKKTEKELHKPLLGIDSPCLRPYTDWLGMQHQDVHQECSKHILNIINKFFVS